MYAEYRQLQSTFLALRNLLFSILKGDKFSQSTESPESNYKIRIYFSSSENGFRVNVVNCE